MSKNNKNIPTRDEIERVSKFLSEQQTKNENDFIDPEDVSSIRDYIRSAASLATALSKSLVSNKIKPEILSLITSEKKRAEQIELVVKKYIMGE